MQKLSIKERKNWTNSRKRKSKIFVSQKKQVFACYTLAVWMWLKPLFSEILLLSLKLNKKDNYTHAAISSHTRTSIENDDHTIGRCTYYNELRRSGVCVSELCACDECIGRDASAVVVVLLCTLAYTLHGDQLTMFTTTATTRIL